ncbi:hypothetical protein JTB14_034643 [Gonioctena quinquepunctata]|nr:hypothetical protein JTB14_034643 [Gonioctena quinquepunctata]
MHGKLSPILNMSGNKCQFYKCGLSAKVDKTIRMYRFPVNHAKRCEKWILHSGKNYVTPNSLIMSVRGFTLTGNGRLADLSTRALRGNIYVANILLLNR